MSEMADDIRKAAAEAHAAFASSSDTRNLGEIIAEAIGAERERCLKRIDDYASAHGARNEHDQDGLLVELTCQELAQIIRGEA